MIDVACLVSEAARGLLPRAAIGAVVAPTALADIAPESSFLAPLGRGEVRLAFAVDEEAARRADSFSTTVEASGGKATVWGEKAYVPDAGSSAVHLVAARENGGVSLVLVDADGEGVQRSELRSFGGDRQANVRYERAPVVERIGAAGQGGEILLRLERVRQAFALAQMLGGMEAVLATTVDYVKEREQFGQKIALFQAVRHQIADMGMRLTASKHLGWQVISRIGVRRERSPQLATALAYVGPAFKELCVTGHHLHGGAGFVVEHSLRFHSERAQSLAIRFAPQAPALEVVAGALLDG